MRVAIQKLTDEMHEYLLGRRFGPHQITYTQCPWCAHEWHATPCGVTNYTGSNACCCDSSRERLDDTWRPRDKGLESDKVRRICHDTGSDGYTAALCVGTSSAFVKPLPRVVKDWLYGRGH